MHYLTDEFENFTANKLSIPDGPEPLQYIAKYAHKKARRDELERRHMGGNTESQLRNEAQVAYTALNGLLGESLLFFDARYSLFQAYLNCSSPGLLDVAAFAYTWTLLRNPELFKLIENLEGLIRHAHRIYELVYNAH